MLQAIFLQSINTGQDVHMCMFKNVWQHSTQYNTLTPVITNLYWEVPTPTPGWTIVYMLSLTLFFLPHQKPHSDITSHTNKISYFIPSKTALNLIFEVLSFHFLSLSCNTSQKALKDIESIIPVHLFDRRSLLLFYRSSIICSRRQSKVQMFLSSTTLQRHIYIQHIVTIILL